MLLCTVNLLPAGHADVVCSGIHGRLNKTCSSGDARAADGKTHHQVFLHLVMCFCILLLLLHLLIMSLLESVMVESENNLHVIGAALLFDYRNS